MRFVALFFCLVLAACQTTEDPEVHKVVDTFEEAGIELERSPLSGKSPFNLVSSREAHYSSEEGELIIFYDTNDLGRVKKELRSQLSEMEWLYEPRLHFNEDSAILFVPTRPMSDSSQVWEILSR